MKYFIIVISIFSCSQMSKVKSQKRWFYQLQNYEHSKFTSNTKLNQFFNYYMVIDPDFDSTKFDINVLTTKLKENNNKVLAYLSIGEAESYRSYFKALPKDFILYENPDWKENFKIKYWKKQWQEIIFKRIKEIKNLGFSGVYLDIVDAFYELDNPKRRAQQMIEFLSKIRQVGGDDFFIVQQNAPDLYKYALSTQQERYLESFDALALEDCFFYGDKKMNNAYAPQKVCLDAIEYLHKKKKLILSVEYLNDQSLIEQYLEKTKDLPIKRLVTNRQLNGQFWDAF